jgi:2-polyprenyl-3-methyl-5-hydroxy-6-metoxy-1,4-benzoquinol methylase
MQNYFIRLQSVLDIIAQHDEMTYASNIKNKYYSAEYLKYTRFIEQCLDKNKPVLDWGALYGHVSILLEESGFDVTSYCVSPSPGSRAALTTQFKAKFIESDEATSLPFKDGSFGAVISSGVFEHWYGPSFYDT